MPTRSFNFYRDGQLVYTCYTKTKSDLYESDLIKRGVEYELKIKTLIR